MAKACWHMPDPSPTAAVDPFSTAAPAPTREPAFDQLVVLLNREAEVGITCPLKDEDWANPTCSSCPERLMYGRGALCEIGVTQEALVACLR